MPASVERVLRGLGLETMLIGTRWWGERCPLPGHAEHNPKHRWTNFFVRDDKASSYARTYHCYSCKGSGKLPELVMQVKGLPYREALDWLAALDDGSAEAAPILAVRIQPHVVGRGLRMPPGVEFPEWRDWIDTPRRYVESRGITAAQVARWGIGYAVDGPLEGRIVIPTFRAGGVLANYQARSYVGHDVRYLSTPERDHPDLAALWGEHLWPSPDERSTLIVFEGAINGLAIERALDGWMVSLGGLHGSLVDHRRAMKFIGWRSIVIATDPDPAGERAAMAIESAVRHSTTQVRRLQYPGKADACDTPIESLRDALVSVLVN